MEQYEHWDDIVVQPKKKINNNTCSKNRQEPPSELGRNLNKKARGGSKHIKQNARRTKTTAVII